MKADYVICGITAFWNVMSCNWHKWDLWFSQWWVSRFCLNFWGVTKHKASHTRRCTHNIDFCKKLKCQNNVTPFNIRTFKVFHPLMFNFNESKWVICVKFHSLKNFLSLIFKFPAPQRDLTWGFHCTWYSFKKLSSRLGQESVLRSMGTCLMNPIIVK